MNKYIVGTTLASITLFVMFIYFLFWGVEIVITKIEISECYKWQRYEEDYAYFELRQEDTERCESLGIKIK